ncbi:MAG: hypothetical protein ACYTE5_02305 [Planctomycetota bacterium]|jgi:hypothetical protein
MKGRIILLFGKYASFAVGCINILNVKSKKAKLCQVLAGCLLVFVVGCESGNKSPVAEQLDTLRAESAQLAYELERAKSRNEQLEGQIKVLSGLPEDKLEGLYEVQAVKVTRYTNLYDKDKDGKYEKLIVYIQPIDEEGDVVKATGAVDVQLWNLNRQEDEALLGSWRIGPEELKELWFATIITINYRLTFDVADKIEEYKEPLTVKVTFTDYLTGKVFQEQRVIKPR